MNIFLRSKPELIRAYPSIKDQCSRVRNIKVMNFFYKCQHLNSPTTPTLRVKVWQLSEWIFSPCRCVQTMFGWWPIPNVEPHGLRWSQSSTNCAIVLTKSLQGLTYVATSLAITLKRPLQYQRLLFKLIRFPFLSDPSPIIGNACQ